MSDNKNPTVQYGPGFLGCLTITFIVLKLCHVIDWRWRWILAPLWAPIAAVLGVLALVLVCLLVAALFIMILKK